MGVAVCVEFVLLSVIDPVVAVGSLSEIEPALADEEPDELATTLIFRFELVVLPLLVPVLAIFME